MSDRIAVMNGGKILQIGTPEDIYERPAARFVADFIGDTNLIEARRIAPTRFRIASGAELETSEDGPESETVTLAIRPERMGLGPPGSGALDGIVEQVVYEGIHTTYHVAVGQGLRLRVCEQNRVEARPRFPKGEKVGVALPATALRVLAE